MSMLHSKAVLGPPTLQNHLVMAPMTRSRATDNIPTAIMVEYYGAMAGLIITEGGLHLPGATAQHPGAAVYPPRGSLARGCAAGARFHKSGISQTVQACVDSFPGKLVVNCGWKFRSTKAVAGGLRPSLAGVAVTRGPKRRQESCGVRKVRFERISRDACWGSLETT